MTDLNPASFGLTAIVPCHNEVECIDRCYETIARELERYADTEILFIDDGSTDGTLERIKHFADHDERVRYISFSRNFGLESAFTAGFTYASKPWSVQLDADLQSPPSEMHKLIGRALDGFDVVFAVRTARADRRHRRLGTWLHQTIATRTLGIRLPIGASVFRVARTSVARRIVESRYSTPYFLAVAPLVGARYDLVPTAHSPRQAGAGKWRLRQLAAHAMELFVGYSYRPLIACYGLGMALTPVLVLALMVGSLRSDVALTSWVAAVAALLGLCLSTVVARYLVRIMRVQAIDSPSYLVREANIWIDPDDHLYGHELDRRPQPDRRSTV